MSFITVSLDRVSQTHNNTCIKNYSVFLCKICLRMVHRQNKEGKEIIMSFQKDSKGFVSSSNSVAKSDALRIERLDYPLNEPGYWGFEFSLCSAPAKFPTSQIEILEPCQSHMWRNSRLEENFHWPKGVLFKLQTAGKEYNIPNSEIEAEIAFYYD